MLCHGTVCVVGKMRDLILQLSKSSIYSTKPLFCHTGKTGAGSKSVSIASERMEIISGQRLIDLLTPGSSFTIATAPQTMMKRTAATLETSTIVKDAGKENRYHES
ncbi:hypothetical protein D3M55_29410 [Klebsiella pneumoniae]|nr:hypothetical protein [Klebsiella pneumoniae]